MKPVDKLQTIDYAKRKHLYVCLKEQVMRLIKIQNVGTYILRKYGKAGMMGSKE